MKILYLTYYSHPESRLGAASSVRAQHESLWYSVADVTVVTGFPRYHVPVMPEQYRGKWFYREEMSRIHVLRINAPKSYGSRRISCSAGSPSQISP